MTSNDLIKKLIISFNSNDNETFLNAAREYIEREKRMKHTQVVKELEKALFVDRKIELTPYRHLKLTPL